MTHSEQPDDQPTPYLPPLDTEESPIHYEAPIERQQRMDRLYSNPDLIHIICSHVANNGSLLGLARVWNARFSDLMKWIRADPVRSRLYDQAIIDRNEWAMERILMELKRISTFDIRELYDDKNTLKPIKDWPDHAAAAIKGIDVSEIWAGSGEERQVIGELKKLHAHDKMKALELHGKNLKMFTDKIESTQTLKLEDLIAASYNSGSRNANETNPKSHGISDQAEPINGHIESESNRESVQAMPSALQGDKTEPA